MLFSTPGAGPSAPAECRSIDTPPARRFSNRPVHGGIAMGRIPRSLLLILSILVSAVVLIADGDRGGRAAAAAPAVSFVEARWYQAVGTRPAIHLSRSSSVPGRVLIRVSSPTIRRVRLVRLKVNGRTAAAIAPRGGRFRGATGWVDASRFRPGELRLGLEIVRRDATIRRSRSISMGAKKGGRPARDTTPPTVSLASPLSGATVSGVTPIDVRATDATGVARVDVAVDGVTLFTDTSAPFGDAGVWDTTLLPDGDHRVVATAFDPAGNRAAASVGVVVSNPVAAPPPAASTGRVLWGAWVDGEPWGYGDAPWDMRTLTRFESDAGKQVSVLHWGQPWMARGVAQEFSTSLFEATRQRGVIPMLDWCSWDTANGGSSSQPDFQLSDITAGRYDAYIRSWATAAKAWGKPFFLRFDHEMNGTWYPWSESRNGNSPGEFVAAWRHVHDIFTAVGATNVTWVWSPNTVYPGSIPLASLYPGDSYVDWAAIDGYNWGTNPLKPAGWASFDTLFAATYDQLGTLAPTKPVMLAEVASSEYGGSKATWIADALGSRLATRYPRIRGVVWFNWNAGGMDWMIESSSTARAAFASALASDRFVGSAYAGLVSSPIPAP
jgi:hypothetical protein